MKFCSACASPLREETPEGDDRPRRVCGACGRIYYSNPKLIVGTLPRTADGGIVLCRRAIEPRKGFWTLPSGFLEDGETLEEGAARETLEESGAEVEMGALFSVFSLPHVNQVYLLFLADVLRRGEYGAESDAVEVFTPDRLPWSQLAFRAIEFALERYVDSPDTERAHLGAYDRGAEGPWILGETKQS